MTTIQQISTLLLVVAALVLIYLLQPILTPFIAGLILGYLGDPLVDRLEAIKVNRTLGVLVVFVVFFSILVSALLIILPMLARELAALLRDVPTFILWLQQNTSPWLVTTFGIDPFEIKLDDLTGRIKDHWQEAGGMLTAILSGATRSGFAFLATLGSIGLTPVVAFYMIRDWDRLMDGLRAMIPRNLEPTFVGLTRECDEVLSAFLRGQLLVMTLLGCIYAVGLTIVGLQLAILIGLLAGLMSIVPYLGFVVGILVAFTVAFFQYQDITYLAYVALVFGLGQALESTVLTPWLVGDKIGLHPVAVIFAVLAGGQLFGFVGILLALPVAAVVMVFLRHLHGRYMLSGYYGQDQPGQNQTPGEAEALSTPGPAARIDTGGSKGNQPDAPAVGGAGTSARPAVTAGSEGQLPLRLQLDEDATLGDYIGVAALRINALQGNIFLTGARGTGKSHLLQGCCHEVLKSGRTAIYLPGLQHLAPAVLEGLEHFDLVCLDDVDRILDVTGNGDFDSRDADSSEWQRALFHLINGLQDRGGRLICASGTSIGALTGDATDTADHSEGASKVTLPDLRSRMRSWHLLIANNLSDADKIQVIRRKAHRRGFDMSEEVCSFILSRARRDMHYLVSLIDQLDIETLRRQKKVTIPLVKDALGL